MITQRIDAAAHSPTPCVLISELHHAAGSNSASGNRNIRGAFFKRHRVAANRDDLAESFVTVHHSQRSRRGEDCVDLGELLLAVCALAVFAEAEEAAVLVQDAFSEHVVDELGAVLFVKVREWCCCGDPAPEARPRDAFFLDRQGHQLMREEMSGAGLQWHGLDEAAGV